MARIRTLDFLPEIFQTPTNAQFLNATLDRLVSQPELQALSGYIGQHYGPGINPKDNYVPEPTKTRTDYQLDPAVVFLKTDTAKAVDFLCYPGMIDALKVEGGIVDDPDNLFAQDFYSWDPFADYDKIVNYTEYYWLPDGPNPVTLTTNIIYGDQNYVVESTQQGYFFDGDTDLNPTITLIRGGTYTFDVDQTTGFWIQGDTALNGADPSIPSLSTREILGVTNNGDNAGTLTFTVPPRNAQDFLLNLPGTYSVDLVTDLEYDEFFTLNPLSGTFTTPITLRELNNIDGIRNLEYKTVLIWKGNSPGVYRITFDYKPDYGWNQQAYSPATLRTERTGVWDQSTTVNLTLVNPQPRNLFRVVAKLGTKYSLREFYKNSLNRWSIIPYISANKDVLYYRDGTLPNSIGVIKIIDDNSSYAIDVIGDILGRKQARVPISDPNGVVLTNGLKVRFQGNVVPRAYLQGEYYVEGVGESIRLIPTTELDVSSEPFLVEGELADKDYITIGRNSINLNAWSRSNRWFHQRVIDTVTAQNNTSIVAPGFSAETARARRPIIEFKPKLKLYNQGTEGTHTISWVDTTTTDALSTVNLQPFSSYHPNGGSTVLSVGDTIIFAADTAGSSNKLFRVSALTTQTNQTAVQESIVLTPELTYQYNQQSYVNKGTNAGATYRFEGTLGNINPYNSTITTQSLWRYAQHKQTVNQEPLFEVFSNAGVPFSDTTVYPGTTFAGNKLFSYARGTGTVVDPVIGFPLKYAGIGNLGDIEFDVNYNSQTFTYTSGSTTITQNVNSGFVYSYPTLSDYVELNGWKTAVAPSLQYQVFTFTIDNTNYNPLFTQTIVTCDIPALDPNNIQWATVNVLIDSVIQDTPAFSYVVENNQTIITINSEVALGQVVNVLIYSDQVSKNAYFEIPQNLSSNPLNETLTSIAAGDIRLQYQSIYRNLPEVTGPVFGSNNINDLGDVVPYGNKIIQNSAPLVLPAVFLRNDNLNFFSALKFNGTEYTKYKSLLIDTVDRGDFSIYNTPAEILDTAIQTIGASRTPANSFYWSDMLPSGSPYISNTYNFATTNARTQFTLSTTYSFVEANYKGVQIYHVRTYNSVPVTTALIRGRDYEIPADSAYAIVTYLIEPGDQIIVNEFNQTFGSYCPNTPSKLGIYPRYVPHVFYDDTYDPATWWIKGHDGSQNKLYGAYNPITGALEDFRDQALLEFETRIYNNAKTLNSTSTDNVPVPLSTIVPGKWRTTDYTYQETVQFNVRQFLGWVGQNRVDYQTQNYRSTDSFTYNYNQTQDRINAELIPAGYWRGAYNWFYDTDHPHDRPWELLGYTEKPTWWLSRYGEAPYTSDNTLLWGDLAQGISWNNGNPVVIPGRIRPQLLDALPVDTEGKLLPPIQSVAGQYDSFKFRSQWLIGDQGPTETSYLKSSQWPFDAVRLMALAEPARFFNYCADIDNYQYNAQLNQWVYDGYQRIMPGQIPVYGNGTPANSYINWIVDYEQQRGVDATANVKNRLSNLDVRLVYRVAGYTSKDQLQFYVEKSSPLSSNNSLLIPDQNYEILLYNNQPFDRIYYSAVIVQKVENGYQIFGNSQVDTYFTTVTPIFNGLTDNITQSGATAKVTTSFIPDEYIYVPYGTVLPNVQAVSEFLVNYGRLLEQQGMFFTTVENTVEISWKYMVREFLYWSQSGWSVGSTIALNPAAKNLIIDKDSSIVQPLTLQQQNFILNQNLIPIQNKDVTILRQQTLFSVTPLNEGDTIAYTNLNISNFEHAIIFDNKTVFNDIIYQLNTGLRQLRLLVRGQKTGNWDGNVNADGFIVNRDNIKEWSSYVKYTKGEIVRYKNKYWVAARIVKPSTEFQLEDWLQSDYTQVAEGLLPNPSTRSVESIYYYDRNNANLEKDASLLSYSLVGFRPRNYLVAANLTDSSQVNVYLNLIKTKGTSLSALAFNNAEFTQGTVSYTTYESWGLKAGEFGGVLNQNYIEFTLDQSKLTGNPGIVTVAANANVTVEGTQQVVGLEQITNYGRQFVSPDFMPTLAPSDYNPDTVFPQAGYAAYTDMKYAAYNRDVLSQVSSPSALNKGNYIWLADDMGTWQVFTPISINATLVTVRNNLNGTANFTFSTNTGLVVNDIIAISDFDDTVNGYYTVTSIASANTITVTVNLDQSIQVLQGQGIALKLTSQRVTTPADINDLNLLNTQFQRNKVWVDRDTDTDWAVYEKTFNYATITPGNAPNTIVTSAVISSALGYITVQGNASTTGTVTRYSTIPGGYDRVNSHTIPVSTYTSISAGTTAIAIGIPASVAKQVYIDRLASNGYITTQAIINSPSTSTSGFGTQVAMSGDDLVLFASDSNNTVFVFQRSNVTSGFDQIQSLSLPALDANSQFGYSLSTNYDGTRVVIGAPQQTVIVDGSVRTEAGISYVFDQVGTAPIPYQLSQTLLHPEVEQGAEFGRSSATNTTASELFIGAPYTASNIDNNLVEGAVYRYVDLGKLLGTVTITVPSSSTGIAGIIRINGVNVSYSSTTASAVATAINTANISNVTASAVGNVLTISLVNTNNGPVNNKLTVTGNQVDLTTLGYTPYSLQQMIVNPYLERVAQFGYTLSHNKSRTLLVGAPTGNQYSNTTFDYTDNDTEDDTVFDHDATQFIDTDENLGAYYMFDFLGEPQYSATATGAYVYSQTLHPSLAVDTQTAKYNYAIAVSTDGAVIGTSSGALFYKNATQVPNWHVLRKARRIVNTNLVQNIQIYDRLTNETISNLDIIDPLMGKILGVVATNIDYISITDPASYDVTAASSPSTLTWGAEQVGNIWVDVTDARWVNYHQDSLEYNSEYFATVFPGSVVQAYTWIASSVTPDQYTGPGTPFSIIDYATNYTEDSTGALVSVYYFWVSNSNTVYSQQGKTMNALTVAAFIADPIQSGIAYIGALDSNTIAIYNSQDSIRAGTSTLHVNIGTAGSLDVAHTQVDLIRDGDPNDFLNGIPRPGNTYTPPKGLYSKFLDSLCGRDAAGRLVPDPALPMLVKTGIALRPRQTMFREIPLALQNYMTYANQVMLAIPITEQKSVGFFSTKITGVVTTLAADANNTNTIRVASTAGITPGMRLVINGARAGVSVATVVNTTTLTLTGNITKLIPRGSSVTMTFVPLTARGGLPFDTADYWSYVDWYATGYSDATKIVIEVQRYYQLQTIQSYNGLVVKVTANGDGKWELYVFEDGAWIRVGLQQGTIQIDSTIWAEQADPINYPSDAIYWISRGLNEQVYTNVELYNRNLSLILMFKFIVSEADDGQNYLPWLNKTSFLDVAHGLRELTENEKYQRDNQEFLRDYLNEVKPYHVFIKDFSLVYKKTDVFQGFITDFDLPAQYDSQQNSFYSPQLVFENPSFNQYLPSNPIWQTTPYINWFQNYGLHLGSQGLVDYPITTLAAYMELPVVINTTQSYTSQTASIQVTDTSKLFNGQYITDNTGAIPLDTIITSINVTTNVITLNASTIAILTPEAVLTVYNPIIVENAYGMLDQGVITIGTEQIAYQVIDRFAGSITGLTRGYNDTTPIAAIVGVPVLQTLPPIQVLDGARGYSIANPPRVFIEYDTTKYPAPRSEVIVEPNLSADGRLLSFDIINAGSGYPVQPDIVVEPPFDPSLRSAFSLDDINYIDNTISLLVPRPGQTAIRNTSAVSISTRIPLSTVSGVRIGQGILLTYPLADTTSLIPGGSSVTGVFAATDIESAYITVNNPVTLAYDSDTSTGVSISFVHQFRTGDPIRFTVPDGSQPPLGLQDGYLYYLGAIGGKVTQVVVTAGGNNFQEVPRVRFLGGGGVGAYGQAVLSIIDDVASIEINDGGNGDGTHPYAEGDEIEIIVDNQIGARYTVNNVDPITGKVIDSPTKPGLIFISGGEYTQIPGYENDTRAVTGTGQGLRVSVFNYEITAVNVITDPITNAPQGGINYTTPPAISFAGGGGTGAAAVAIIDDGRPASTIAFYNNKRDSFLNKYRVDLINDGRTSDVKAYHIAVTPVINSTWDGTNVRSLDTKIIFDRTSYRSNLNTWVPYRWYSGLFNQLQREASTSVVSSVGLQAYLTATAVPGTNILTIAGRSATVVAGSFTYNDITNVVTITFDNEAIGYNISNVNAGDYVNGNVNYKVISVDILTLNETTITYYSPTNLAPIVGSTITFVPNIGKLVADAEGDIDPLDYDLIIVTATGITSSDSARVYADSMGTGIVVNPTSVTVRIDTTVTTAITTSQPIKFSKYSVILEAAALASSQGVILPITQVVSTNPATITVDWLNADGTTPKVTPGQLDGQALGFYSASSINEPIYYYASIEYTGSTNTSVPLQSTRLRLWYDDSLTQQVTSFPFLAGDIAILNTPISFERSIVSYQGSTWRCIESNNDSVFEIDKWERLFSDSTSLNALDRIAAYYAPTTSMPANINSLMTGLEYPNSQFKGSDLLPDSLWDQGPATPPEFAGRSYPPEGWDVGGWDYRERTESLDLDTILRAPRFDVTRPTVYDVQGGNFADGYGPEELVAGNVTDNLLFKVKTRPGAQWSPLAEFNDSGIPVDHTGYTVASRTFYTSEGTTYSFDDVVSNPITLDVFIEMEYTIDLVVERQLVRCYDLNDSQSISSTYVYQYSTDWINKTVTVYCNPVLSAGTYVSSTPFPVNAKVVVFVNEVGGGNQLVRTSTDYQPYVPGSNNSQILLDVEWYNPLQPSISFVPEPNSTDPYLPPIVYRNGYRVLYRGLTGVTINSPGKLYSPTIGDVQVMIDVPRDDYPSGNIIAGGLAATGQVIVGSSGVIEGITILDPGYGYVPAGTLSGIAVTVPGAGYIAVPAVTVDTPTQAATLSITATAGVISSITIDNGGWGYTDIPQVSIAGVNGLGSGATATVTLGTDSMGRPGSVLTVTIVNAGTEYTQGATISIDLPPPGTRATATAIMEVNSITVNNGGTGYSIGDVVTIVGGTIQANTVVATATVTSVSSTEVTGLVIVTSGNYVTLPSITGADTTVDPTGGTGLTVDLTFAVKSITVANVGSGYTFAPRVSIALPTATGVASPAQAGSYLKGLPSTYNGGITLTSPLSPAPAGIPAQVSASGVSQFAGSDLTYKLTPSTTNRVLLTFNRPLNITSDYLSLVLFGVTTPTLNSYSVPLTQTFRISSGQQIFPLKNYALGDNIENAVVEINGRRLARVFYRVDVQGTDGTKLGFNAPVPTSEIASMNDVVNIESQGYLLVGQYGTMLASTGPVASEWTWTVPIVEGAQRDFRSVASEPPGADNEFFTVAVGDAGQVFYNRSPFDGEGYEWVDATADLGFTQQLVNVTYDSVRNKFMVLGGQTITYSESGNVIPVSGYAVGTVDPTSGDSITWSSTLSFTEGWSSQSSGWAVQPWDTGVPVFAAAAHRTATGSGIEQYSLVVGSDGSVLASLNPYETDPMLGPVWAIYLPAQTGVTEDFTSIVYNDDTDDFVIVGKQGSITKLNIIPSAVASSAIVSVEPGGFSFSIDHADAVQLVIGQRVSGGPILSTQNAYITSIDTTLDVISITNNKLSGDGSWNFQVGDVMTFGEQFDFTAASSGTTTDFKRVTYNGNAGSPVYLALGTFGITLTSTDGITWVNRPQPQIDANNVAYGSDDNTYVVVGSLGYVWSIDPTTSYTLDTIRQFDPTRLRVWVNGIPQIYGSNWQINFAPPQFKTLFDGEYGGLAGYFNSTSFEATSLFVVFNMVSRPPANAVIKMVYESSLPTYTIQGQRLAIFQQLTPGDTLAVTTYNYTTDQSLNTEFFTGSSVSPIYDMFTPVQTSDDFQPLTVSTGPGSIAVVQLGNPGVGYTSDSGIGGDVYLASSDNGGIVSTSGGTGAIIAGTLATTSSIAQINITDGGSGYTVPPIVTIDAPTASGLTATATATLTGDVVTSITVTNFGSGYEGPTSPTVTITAQSGDLGVDATAEAVLGWGFASVAIVSGGVGYTTETTTIAWPASVAGTPVFDAQVSIGIEGYEHQLITGDIVRIQDARGPEVLNSTDPLTTFNITNITRANPGVVTVSGEHHYYDGLQVIIRGVTGMSGLDDNVYYVKVTDLATNKFALYNDRNLTLPASTTTFEPYVRGGVAIASPTFFVKRLTPYEVALYYDSTLADPVIGLNVPEYLGGGYIWQYQAFSIGQPNWKLVNPDRLWGTIDGARIDPDNIRFYADNEIAILQRITTDDELVITSMTPYRTVGEMDFSITVSQDYDNKFIYNIVGVELLTAGSADWGTNPDDITVIVDQPDMFGGSVPEFFVTLNSRGLISGIYIDPAAQGTGYSFVPKIKLIGPGTSPPETQVIVQSTSTPIGTVRNTNPYTRTWLTSDLLATDTVIHVYDASRLIERFEVRNQIQQEQWTNQVTGTVRTIVGIALPKADYNQIVELEVSSLTSGTVYTPEQYELQFVGNEAFVSFKDYSILNASVGSVNIVSGGIGPYTSTPAVTIGAPVASVEDGGIQATALAVMTNVVNSLTITNRGQNYQAIPTLEIVGDGTGATARVTAMRADTVSVTSGGGGADYAVGDIVEVVGGSGTQATVRVLTEVSGVVATVEILAQGNYTVLPGNTSVTTEAQTGIGTGLLLNLGYELSTVQLLTMGTGYETTPSVVVTGAASTTAVIDAVLVNAIGSILITNPGLGYDPEVPPTVQISGAVAVAVIDLNGDQIVAKFSIGNTLELNGEIIKFEAIDTVYNVVSKITRGYGGSAVNSYAESQTIVQSRLPRDIMPIRYYTEAWNDGYWGPLGASITAPAQFLQRDTKPEINN